MIDNTPQQYESLAKVDYSQLTDPEINKLVCCSLNPDANKMALSDDGSCFYHCGIDGNWSDGGPIIQDNGIALFESWDENGAIDDTIWTATTSLDKSWVGDRESGYDCEDKNPLRAAMIVFLMMKDANK